MVHEFGHLLAALLLRIPIRRIAVGLGPAIFSLSLGRGTQLEVRALPVSVAIGVPGRRAENGENRRPLRHDLEMCLAGPLTNVALSLLILALAILGWVPQGFYSWFAATATLSTIVALLNLIPLPGLDGGHLLLLGLASMGMQWSPEGEAMLHRVGLRLGAAVCALLLLAQYGNAALDWAARLL